MDEEKQTETQKVFLEQGNFRTWERPLPPGCFRSPLYNGSTKLVRYIDFESFDELIGNYRIAASAAKYLADIIPHDNKYILEEDNRQPERMVLFTGSIAIYSKGKIPGTELEGYDLKKQGMIWIAEKEKPKLVNTGGLRHIVLQLGNCSDINQRIEAIIAGYEHQEDEIESAQHQREFENYRHGQRDALDR